MQNSFLDEVIAGKVGYCLAESISTAAWAPHAAKQVWRHAVLNTAALLEPEKTQYIAIFLWDAYLLVHCFNVT